MIMEFIESINTLGKAKETIKCRNFCTPVRLHFKLLSVTIFAE